MDTAKIVGGSKLLGEMRDLIRRKHYSIHTEQAYLRIQDIEFGATRSSCVTAKEPKTL